MSEAVRKAPFRCPDCQFVQLEPVHLVSTYCRACASHYSVERNNRADSRGTPQKQSFLGTAIRKILTRPPRAVFCHQCEHTHEVSGYARSTICPRCSSFIELTDISLSANTSRPVDTRGHLHVEPGAYLNSALIICGSALIEGRISGELRCEGEVRLANIGRCSCRISAASISIEKSADLQLVYPLKTSRLSVHGHVEGAFRCAGHLQVHKGGSLRGMVKARSLSVDRGGAFIAENIIQNQEEALPPPSQQTAPAAAEQTLAFQVSPFATPFGAL